MVLVVIVWEAHWNVGEAEQVQWPKLANAHDNDNDKTFSHIYAHYTVLTIFRYTHVCIYSNRYQSK